MPNDKDWKTKRFVDPSDLRHDMHLNIVSFGTRLINPFSRNSCNGACHLYHTGKGKVLFEWELG